MKAPDVAHHLRWVGTGLLAGGIAGFLVTGIGGRIVMRIIAVVDPHTETEFTADTMFLLIAGGLIGAQFGALGGVLFMGIRRFLPRWSRWPRCPRSWVWSGLTFGAIWLLMTGGIFLSIGQVEEFSDFDPPVLGISLFAVLFVVYGLTVAAIVEQLGKWVPTPRGSRTATVGGLGAMAALSLAGLLLHIRAIGSILEAAG